MGPWPAPGRDRPQGEAQARESLDRYVSRLARGLAVVCDVLDPAAIVLGGGMSLVDALYPAVEVALGPLCFTDAPVVKVVRNRHGDSSGVRGAAWLWPAQKGQPHPPPSTHGGG